MIFLRKIVITAAEKFLLVIEGCFLSCMDTESKLKITSVRNFCVEKVPVLRPFFYIPPRIGTWSICKAQSLLLSYEISWSGTILYLQYTCSTSWSGTILYLQYTCSTMCTTVFCCMYDNVGPKREYHYIKVLRKQLQIISRYAEVVVIWHKVTHFRPRLQTDKCFAACTILLCSPVGCIRTTATILDIE